MGWCCVTRLGPSHSLLEPRRYVDVHPTLNGVMLNADRRGHQNFSNEYWKRAPPVGANTDTSDFYIKIRAGFQFVITDMHNESACLPGTEINEWPISKYNLGFEGEPTEVARAAAATAAAGSAAARAATEDEDEEAALGM